MSRNTCSMVNWFWFTHCIKKGAFLFQRIPHCSEGCQTNLIRQLQRKKIEENTYAGCNKKTCDPFNFQPLKLESKLRLYEMNPLEDKSRVGKWTSFVGRESLSEQSPIIGMYFYYTNS